MGSPRDGAYRGDKDKNHTPVSWSAPMCGIWAPRDPKAQSAIRNHFIAATGEFVGTFQFLFVAFLGHSMAVTQSPNSDITSDGGNSNQTVIYIAMAYGFSLLVTAWTMYRISGGLFNPAVTLGMTLTGTLPWVRGLILFPTQILGGICAAAVAKGIIPSDIRITQTTLGPRVTVAQGVFLEMFLTSLLVFTVLMLAAEKSKDTFIAPIGIGLALFVAEIAGVYYTGASLNPARSFGPCVVAPYFQRYHWIYWIGPSFGALLAAGYYHFVKFFNYEEANPGQDSANGQFDMQVEKSMSIPSPSAEERQNDLDSRMEAGTLPGADFAGGAAGNSEVNGFHPGYGRHL